MTRPVRVAVEHDMTTWFCRTESPGFATLPLNGDTGPCPTIMAGGIAGGNTSQYFLMDDGKDTYRPDGNKPPYRVPSMEEIRRLPWNGLTVASTFAGGGGSSTGYRMAGYRVLWANEFVPAARGTYLANARPGTVVDGRDIRDVPAENILSTTGLKVGELDIFDGSPPCTSFSTAGKREKGWGKVIGQGDHAQRADDLFFDYARLVRDLQPKVFVAENVSGLVKGTAKGYFLEILSVLKAAGYRVSARLLDAQWLGVPQARQRLIFVGVRNDLACDPVHPAPLSHRYSIRDALPWIGGMTARGHGYFGGGKRSVDRPAPTVPATRDGAAYYDHEVQENHPGDKNAALEHVEVRKFTIAEVKRLCGFPDDYVLRFVSRTVEATRQRRPAGHDGCHREHDPRSNPPALIARGINFFRP